MEKPAESPPPGKSHSYHAHPRSSVWSGFFFSLRVRVVVLLLSQQDLSPGPLSALCCAPLVEEVLVYCLHDLVKYVYMNDDRLVSTHMIIITLSY